MLQVGSARRVINPEQGFVCGYGSDYPIMGVHDDLAATALYLSDGQRQAIFINYDLIGFRAGFIERIAQAVSEATGVPADCVFTATTHTHSGPEVRTYEFEPERNQRHSAEYNDNLVKWSAEAAAEAKGNAEECILSYNYTFAAENMNRRYFFPDRRSLYIPQNKQLAGTSSEYVDREVGVIAFKKKGTPNRYKAILVNYTAHPLCVGNTSNLVSADYHGYLHREVENTFAGCICLSTTGAAGDHHPLRPESGFAEAERMGKSLASQAIARVYDSIPVEWDSTLRLGRRRFAIKARDEYTANLLPQQKYRDWRPPTFGKVSEFPASVSFLGIGPILLAGMPGETVAEVGAMIKWSSPFLKTYVLFQSTDALGYMPTANQFVWGGYEAVRNRFAQGVGEKVYDEFRAGAAELLREQPLHYPPLGEAKEGY